MKTENLIIITLAILLCISCKKHECAELSWSDYNSVEDVYCNFKYIGDECTAHKGDTLKVVGWLVESTERNSSWQYLTSRRDLQFSHNGSRIYTNPFVCLRLPDIIRDGEYIVDRSVIPDNPYDSMLYVEGVLQYESIPGDFYLDVVNFQTNPKHENK